MEQSWRRSLALRLSVGAPSHIHARHIAQAAVIALVLFLATWRVSVVPTPWYDEGVNLQAARTLAQTGRYGVIYDAEPHLFDLQLTTGPTVIAPVAAVLRASGGGLREARLVMAAYILLAVLGVYRLAQDVYGSGTGLLAVLVLCAAGDASPVFARAVVGEIAALAFLVWGFVVLARARRSGRVLHYAAAGALFGCAILTKGQFGLLVPALAVAWTVQRRRFTWPGVLALSALLLAPPAAWQLFQLLSLGSNGYLEHLGEQQAASSVSAIAPFLSGSEASVMYLVSSAVPVFALIGLAYVWRARYRDTPERLSLVVFATFWLVWYVAFSVGYPRYAIPLVTLCCVFLAVLLRDAAAATRGRRRLAVTGIAVFGVVSSIALQMRPLLDPIDLSAAAAGGLITQTVPPESNVESLEWELDILTERRFHHPPPLVPAIPYAVPRSTAYLVDGPASKSTELYVAELANNPYEHVATVGPYDLYRRVGAP